MRKYFILSLFAVAIFSVSVVSAVGPNFQPAEVTNPTTDQVKNTIEIPSQAKEVAPNIFYLGESTHNGQLVEGYAFVNYKKGYGKPGTECGNGVCEPSENKNNCPQDCGGGDDEEEDTSSSCYEFLTKDAEWKTPESWIMNPSNVDGLGESELFSVQSSALQKWEDAADGTVGDSSGIEIFSDGILTTETLVADTDSPDDKNEVYFGDVSDDGAIAVTVVWGVFRGKPSDRKLVEWDQVYDQVDFDWSLSGEANKMDFENIATHEDGHSAGLGDLYESDCSEQTMYGYASEGEIKKRTLEVGDITGISQLY